MTNNLKVSERKRSVDGLGGACVFWHRNHLPWMPRMGRCRLGTLEANCCPGRTAEPDGQTSVLPQHERSKGRVHAPFPQVRRLQPQGRLIPLRRPTAFKAPTWMRSAVNPTLVALQVRFDLDSATAEKRSFAPQPLNWYSNPVIIAGPNYAFGEERKVEPQ